MTTRCYFKETIPPGYIIESDTMFMPKGKSIVYHKYYVLDYNEKHEQANWVAYYLEPEELVKNVDRTNNFRVDPLVKTGSAELIDYKYSGYDRGHLAPAADFAFSYDAMSESFYMSNVIPQDPGLNRYKWLRLEKFVRRLAKQKHGVYIITGPVFKDDRGEIGVNHVTIPGYVFKIIYDPHEAKVLAFLIPNKKVTQSIETFTTTVDYLEYLTGIDFLYQLEDNTENEIESSIDVSEWFF
jgi:endonuclease G